MLWIGGATDCGKTSITELLAQRYGLQRYHYDRHDLRQMTKLAQTKPRYREFLEASLEEKWVNTAPEDMFAFLMRGFSDRFPLVLDDFLEMPKQPNIIAEGFGLMSALVAPLLSNRSQAVWLVPTSKFKLASMERRGKPSFRDKVSDPEKAARNLFQRDMLLAEYVRSQADNHGLRVIEVDGSRSIERVAELVEDHFAPHLKDS